MQSFEYVVIFSSWKEETCIIGFALLIWKCNAALFFFSWNFTFAKVERRQITENCGISWEDSVMVEPI